MHFLVLTRLLEQVCWAELPVGFFSLELVQRLVFTHNAGVCVSWTALIFLQVRILLCSSCIFNTHTPNTAGSWREESSRHTCPVSDYSTTARIQTTTWSVNLKTIFVHISSASVCFIIRPELFPYLLGEHQTLPPLPVLHSELQGGNRTFSASDCAFWCRPSARMLSTFNKVSVGCPVSL